MPQQFTITRTWTATDDSTNSVSDTQIISVNDLSAPSFNICPGAMTVECDGAGNTASFNAFKASAAGVDHCGAVTVTHNNPPLSDGCGVTGAAEVIWEARDECNNVSTCQQVLTIVDTSAPQVSLSPPVSSVTVSDIDGSGSEPVTLIAGNQLRRSS